MRGDADERAALLTMPAGAVNEEVRAATEESMAIMKEILMQGEAWRRGETGEKARSSSVGDS